MTVEYFALFLMAFRVVFSYVDKAFGITSSAPAG